MKSIYLKLLEAQKKIGAIKKDKANPFFKSKYADINAYIEEAKPILNSVGLVILQPLTTLEGRMALKTVIVDSENGEEIESVAILPENPDPQKMGSIITYFRRYAIQSLLFLQAEDDDANKTSVPTIQYEKVGNKTVVGNSQVPNCSICGKPMKKTKPGSKVAFFCKHDDNWGKPVYPEPQKTTTEEKFIDDINKGI